jgi:glycogen debranching enzyme
MTTVEANLLGAYAGGSYSNSGFERPGRFMAFSGDAIDPHPVYLLESREVLLERKPVEIKQSAVIEPIDALMMISQTSNNNQIGENPVLASVNTKENKGNQDLELFEVFFGRDGEVVASDMLKDFPEIAHTTINILARTQGTEEHFAREEEKGKIVHEARPADNPIALQITSEKGWGWPYYGAIDSTPRYLTLIDSYIQRQKNNNIMNEEYVDTNGEKHTISHSARLAIDWLEKRLLKSPAGMLEYRQETAGGIENQVWRDSREAYHHADGTLAENIYGIASFSAQIDAYKALSAASRLFTEQTGQYLQKAYALKKNILNFWVEDERGGYFALGAERGKNDTYRLLKIRTSDMGHILDSDILDGEDEETVRRRDMLVTTLFSPDMLATSGIRSLGKNELRFNAGAYHNGSVWLRENNIIARGLARHKYDKLAYALHKRNSNIWRVSGIFPEKVLGNDAEGPQLSKRIVDAEEVGRGVYRVEQPAQPVQAWSVTSVIESLRYIHEFENQNEFNLSLPY